ncbi:MAG TPA: trypsin-like peptidase domain-containing protein [Verrucomicrobiae bacterium]|nr:trypsin-like peptidase domain-containing protein [Verrucomicrobiae bacterium]
MKTMKFCLLLFLAAGFGPVHRSIAAEAERAKNNPNLELARQLNQAFVEVAEEVSPAVVVINVTQKAQPALKLPSGSDEGDGEDPLDRFPPEFRRFFREHQFDEGPPEKTQGEGSGIIIRPDGYILTNRHVVDDAEKIEVRLKDGRIFKNAVVRGVDGPSDVAVIKIDAKDLPVARLADSSKTRVGEFAIAIGAPFALDYSVTFGHVSAKDRSNIIPDEMGGRPSMTDQSFIQTDANINPGNSGGPLININGEVIGVNTLIRGLHTGIGFAIPINMAKEVAEQLIARGKFTRSWLGVSIVSLREYPDFRDLVPGVQEGVVVREIVPNGPAAKSDLRPADVVTAVDGKPVITSQQLKDEIRGKGVGQTVVLEVFRKGKQIKINVQPGEWTERPAETTQNERPEPASTGGLGLQVKPMTRELADQFHVDMAPGVLVTRVDEKGLAAQSGIKRGDVITSVNEQPVTNLQQFNEALRKADTKKGVMVTLVSGGARRFEILKQGEE